MSKPLKTRGKPLASTVATDDPAKKEEAKASARRIQYRFIAAPLDVSPSAPGANAADKIVTDSASNLNGLPYVVTASGGKTRVLNAKLKGKSYAELGRPHNTPEITVPDGVDAVEIYIGNDAYESRRFHPLFTVTPNAQGLTIVTVHELPQKRLKRLQDDPNTAKDYPAAGEGKTVKKEDNTYIGYLTGDVWKTLSYEFTMADVRRLCTASDLSRDFKEDQGRNLVTPLTNTPRAPQVPAVPAANPAATQQDQQETLSISDWSVVLAPIYESRIEELTGTTHDQMTGYVDLPVVNIRLRYQTGAFANAVGASNSVQPADVLKRTNPLAYKGIVEAAWKTGIDELILSSTWRPMLGSKLHRMGVAVDVIFVDDYDDRDNEGREIDKFKVHLSSGVEPSSLYSTFSAIAMTDSTNLGGFKADPWDRKAGDNLHKNHMHVSATDNDAK